MWACFVEMPVSSGSGHSRLDFFAMNVWPSEKFRRIAYEIKVSRSDFNKELNQPAKRAPAEKYANECFFVMPVGIAKVDEIPEGWGLIELYGGKGGLKKKKNAKWREVDDPDLGFISSMIRRTADEKPKLPASFWMVEGTEVDQGGLEKYIESQVRLRKIDWQFEMREKVTEEQAEAANKLNRLESIIRSYIGWTYTDPDEFLTWCKAHSQGDIDRDIGKSFGVIKRTRDMLTGILEEREKDKELKKQGIR